MNDDLAQHYTASSVKCNTFWAAPEIIFFYENPGHFGASKCSDIYSFGSVMLQVSRPGDEALASFDNQTVLGSVWLCSLPWKAMVASHYSPKEWQFPSTTTFECGLGF
jgi:serine/threonine protein kinase